jgi:polyphosphate glucokinase
MSSAVGVDIGGSGIKGALVDTRSGSLLTERVRLETPQPATPAAVSEVVAAVVARVGAEAPVGATLPAVVRHGRAETAANIDATWIGTDAESLLSAAVERPVTVLNDADAAGIAEVTFGAGKDVAGVVVVLTLGTGIGSAVFTDGRLVPNTELGHLHLHHQGDAEDWAADSVRERENLSWKEWADRVEHYLRHLESLLWPDLFIIGGGVSKKSDKFLPRISLRTPMVPAVLLNNAGIVGAAMQAQRLLGQAAPGGLS